MWYPSDDLLELAILLFEVATVLLRLIQAVARLR